MAADNSTTPGVTRLSTRGETGLMKAIHIDDFGDVDVLKYADVQIPEPGADEILIDVKATAVSRFHTVVRRFGWPKMPFTMPPPPYRLGNEASGIVAATGDKVTEFKVGDAVVNMSFPACGSCTFCERGLDNLCIKASPPGITTPGSHAEFYACSQSAAIKTQIPESFEKLTCSVWSYSTAWNQAVISGGLKAGQTVLVTGASGALGTSAVQIAHLVGSPFVIGTTESEAKASRLQEYGCDQVVVGSAADMAESVRELTHGRGVDLVIDSVGGTYLEAGIRSLARGGTLVTIAELGGGRSIEIDGGYLFREALSVKGTRGATRTSQRLMVEFLEAGKIDPVIDRVLPLSEAAEAHRAIEARETVGRVVLVP